MAPQETNPASTAGRESEASLPAPTPGQRRSREEALQIVADIKPLVQVAHTRDGEPVVQVQYPWYELPRPSVQIGWFEETADLAAAEPLSIDGKAAEEIWQTQVNRLNKPTYPSSAEVVKTSVTFIDRGNGELITLRGRENLLGKESAYAVEKKTGTPIVVYLLDRWADDQGVLTFAVGDFDLSRKFQTPGKLRVWLLSEEQAVWSETVDWPGDKRQAPLAEQPGPSPEAKQPEPSGRQPVPGPMPALSADAGFPSQPGSAKPEQIATPQPKATTTAPETAGQPGSEAATEGAGNPGETMAPPEWKPSTNKTAGAGNQPQPQPPPPQAQPKNTAPARQSDTDATSVEALARRIEKQFGPSMSPEVRRFWLNGWRYYFVVQNPPNVRRKIFMDMLSAAYDQEPPVKLRNALKELYQRLQAEQQRVER